MLDEGKSVHVDQALEEKRMTLIVSAAEREERLRRIEAARNKLIEASNMLNNSNGDFKGIIERYRDALEGAKQYKELEEEVKGFEQELVEAVEKQGAAEKRRKAEEEIRRMHEQKTALADQFRKHIEGLRLEEEQALLQAGFSEEQAREMLGPPPSQALPAPSIMPTPAENRNPTPLPKPLPKTPSPAKEELPAGAKRPRHLPSRPSELLGPKPSPIAKQAVPVENEPAKRPLPRHERRPPKGSVAATSRLKTAWKSAAPTPRAAGGDDATVAPKPEVKNETLDLALMPPPTKTRRVAKMRGSVSGMGSASSSSAQVQERAPPPQVAIPQYAGG